MPFALVESGRHGLTLTAVNAAARREGIEPGRTLADARAAYPALLTGPAETERDRAALLALAGWTGRYGPRRNVDGEDGVWIDITGVAHLFGDERGLARDLLTRLVRCGITARLGIADTSGAAAALARFAAHARKVCVIAEPGKAGKAIAGLPVEALRLPSEATRLLRRLGLARIGQLYDLPREALAQRFRGEAQSRAASRKREREAWLAAGNVLLRLDQALGRRAEPRLALEESPVHRVEQLFAEPLVSDAGLTAAVDDLAARLEQRLAARCEGATRFTLGIYRADGTAHHVTVGASRPCRIARHICDLLRERLAALDAGFGIDAVSLAADLVAPMRDDAPTFAGRNASAVADATATLIDRLSNKLGPQRVQRLQWMPSHIPETAEIRVPAIAAGTAPAVKLARPPERPPRPHLLLPAPEPITVLAEVPEGPPLRFSWRRITRRIVRASGPERIAPEWWRAITARPADTTTLPVLARNLTRTRDYYTIEDEHGGRYWVFRAGLYGSTEGEEEEESADAPDPVWFMHGVFG